MSVWDLKRLRWAVVLTSATLFIVSLTQTAFVVDVSYNTKLVEPRDYGGAELLVSGWLGVLWGYIAWFANPIIAVTWGLYLRNARSAAPVSAVLGLALTLSFLLEKTIPDTPKEGDLSPIIYYGIGYWLWVASATILAAGVGADLMFQRVINAPARPPV